jgi:hypothetical protein
MIYTVHLLLQDEEHQTRQSPMKYTVHLLLQDEEHQIIKF